MRYARCAILIACLVAGCGGQTIDRPTRPVWCPSGSFVIQPNQRTTRVKGSVDVRMLLGMRPARAAVIARRHGCTWRVVSVNGRGATITADGRKDRVDATVNDGIVTAIAVF